MTRRSPKAVSRGFRTVTSWIRAAGLSVQFRSCYTAVAAAGKKAEAIAASLVRTVVQPLVSGVERVTLAIDDTPTKRYGPHVQGAGVHHNPTPGPAGSSYLYGHVFVVLAQFRRVLDDGVFLLLGRLLLHHHFFGRLDLFRHDGDRSRPRRRRFGPPGLEQRLGVELRAAFGAGDWAPAHIVETRATGLTGPLQTPVGLRHVEHSPGHSFLARRAFATFGEDCQLPSVGRPQAVRARARAAPVCHAKTMW